MNTINPTYLKSVSAEINAALKTVGEKHGLQLSIGSMTYTDTSFTTKLTAKLNRDADGNSIDTEKADFERSAPLFRTDVSKYGAKFRANGDTWEIVALKPRSPKYPVIAKNNKGKRYKFGTEVLDRATS